MVSTSTELHEHRVHRLCCAPVGSVETAARPAVSTPTHRPAVGHEIPRRGSEFANGGWLSMTVRGDQFRVAARAGVALPA